MRKNVRHLLQYSVDEKFCLIRLVKIRNLHKNPQPARDIYNESLSYVNTSLNPRCE